MSREVCKHGESLISPIDGKRLDGCLKCLHEISREENANRKERRAEWIRNNVATIWCYDKFDSITQAEKMADDLIARGYL